MFSRKPGEFMKRLVVFLAVLAVILTNISACSSEDTASEKKVGLIVSEITNPFFREMADGVEKECARRAMDVTVLDSGNNLDAERSHMESLIRDKVDIIILNPADSKGSGASAELAAEAGIPLITIDRSLEGFEPLAHVASDNNSGGALAADFLIRLFPDGGTLLLVEGIQDTSANQGRVDGFRERIEASSILVLADSFVADFDKEQAKSQMEQRLSDGQRYDGVFAVNDEMALGIVEALLAADQQTVVVGFDGIDAAIDAVNSGYLAATVLQQPFEMGVLAVKGADEHLKGNHVTPYIPVDLKLITIGNQ